ncbi:hypothetical protein C6501_15455 [Candidatus Poribacteria bacterium]|nr:MAG: hypothetical protein C6501_15455 [Candidatus Poribacteria bacterium]
MYSEKGSILIFLIGLTILVMLGCGGNTDEPGDPPADDLMLKEKLVGEWDVVSVNDIEPSRFLTVLMVKELDEDIPGEEEKTVPAAPREGEFVIIEDELQEVYHVKADVQDFYYTFDVDDLWTLHVKFDVLPNDEAPPREGDAASDPGGEGEDPPPDPNKPAAPAANGTNETISIVVGTWSGTYSVEADLLSLTLDAEDVKVTPHPDSKALFEEITDSTEADANAELTDKFRIRLINPFSKTFISIDDAGKLILKVPGSSRGKMHLEKR